MAKFQLGDRVVLTKDWDSAASFAPPTGAKGYVSAIVSADDYRVNFDDFGSVYCQEHELNAEENQQPDGADVPAAADTLTHSQALHKLEYVYGVLLTEPREVLAKLQQQAADNERLQAEVETLKNIGELWTSTNDSRNAVLIENADLHAANRALQEQRDSYQKKYMEVLDDDANLWARVCVAVGHPVCSGNTDELLTTIKARLQAAAAALVEKQTMWRDWLTTYRDYIAKCDPTFEAKYLIDLFTEHLTHKIEAIEQDMTDNAGADLLARLQVLEADRDAARKALKPFADVYKAWLERPRKTQLFIDWYNWYSRDFEQKGQYTFNWYAKAADTLAE